MAVHVHRLIILSNIINLFCVMKEPFTDLHYMGCFYFSQNTFTKYTCFNKHRLPFEFQYCIENRSHTVLDKKRKMYSFVKTVVYLQVDIKKWNVSRNMIYFKCHASIHILFYKYKILPYSSEYTFSLPKVEPEFLWGPKTK